MVKAEKITWETADSARYELTGLSTDEKPTEQVASNSLFVELDTGDVYYYTGSEWAKFGGAG